MMESVVESIESKGLSAMTVGFPPMVAAKRSESAVSTTKAIPSPTDHLPGRVFGIKFNLIYFYYIKKPPQWRFFMAGPAGLEPVTSRVTGECSNQLSYDPVVPERGLAPLT